MYVFIRFQPGLAIKKDLVTLAFWLMLKSSYKSWCTVVPVFTESMKLVTSLSLSIGERCDFVFDLLLDSRGIVNASSQSSAPQQTMISSQTVA